MIMVKNAYWVLLPLYLLPSCVWAGWGEPLKLPYPVNPAADSGYSFDPFVTRDGYQLYFVSCRQPYQWTEDIWVVRWDGQGWDSLTHLGENVNIPGWRQLDPSLSADGKRLYFATGGGYGGFDLWVSTWQDTGWGVAQNLGPNINSGFTERSVCISADDNTLYIGANRFEPADLNLWTSRWDGVAWTPIELMGPPLLSQTDTYEPFVTADESTLYFIRWTHQYTDIFVSRFQNGGWSNPESLDYPINTEYHDNGPCLSPDDTKLYFSSTREDTAANSISYIYVSVWDTTGVGEAGRQQRAPGKDNLGPVFPNPARKEVRIVYSVGEPGLVEISLYDILGRLVARLVKKEEGVGRKEVVWRERGRMVGVYFLRFKTAQSEVTQRMVFLE